jgi:hypothetical protein
MIQQYSQKIQILDPKYLLCRSPRFPPGFCCSQPMTIISQSLTAAALRPTVRAPGIRRTSPAEQAATELPT